MSAGSLAEYVSTRRLIALLGISRAQYFKRVRPMLGDVPRLQVGRTIRWHEPSVVQTLQAVDQ